MIHILSAWARDDNYHRRALPVIPREAIQPYLEPAWRCVGAGKNSLDHSCDNALLFSATHLVLSGDLEYVETFRQFAWACGADLPPGLYHRYPGDQGDNAHDDLTGVAAASALFGLPFARAIAEHGEKNFWCLNVQNPGVFDKLYFWARIPDFVPAIKSSAERKQEANAKKASTIAKLEALGLTADELKVLLG